MERARVVEPSPFGKSVTDTYQASGRAEAAAFMVSATLGGPACSSTTLLQLPRRFPEPTPHFDKTSGREDRASGRIDSRDHGRL
jgi:hypothetical protein